MLYSVLAIFSYSGMFPLPTISATLVFCLNVSNIGRMKMFTVERLFYVLHIIWRVLQLHNLYPLEIFSLEWGLRRLPLLLIFDDFRIYALSS